MSDNLIITARSGGDFTPHPEGIFPAVCADVIDMGMQMQEFNGERKSVLKLKICFETEHKDAAGKVGTIEKTFTASLHPKAKLNGFLSKWRGKPILDGEDIDLKKLLGACCTLVISHQQNMSGKTYANIDAVSKPTKKLALSGTWDGAARRKQIAEWQAKQAKVPQPAAPVASPAPEVVHKSNAAKVAAQDEIPMDDGVDTEVNF